MMLDEAKRAEINAHYQHGRGSIQDLARIHGVSVDQVLEIIGETTLSTVSTQGDLIDASELGPEASISYGKQFKVPFSTN